MSNSMIVSDSEKKMIEAMRATGVTPYNMVQMACSHAIKIKSAEIHHYDQIVESLEQ